MDIPKATIDGLRKKHGRIFASTIRLPSGNELGFAWRLPEMADWTISEEANRGSGGGISGAEAANRQIMAAVIVHPARAGIMDALRPYPLAINQWFQPRGAVLRLQRHHRDRRRARGRRTHEATPGRARAAQADHHQDARVGRWRRSVVLLAHAASR